MQCKSCKTTSSYYSHLMLFKCLHILLFQVNYIRTPPRRNMHWQVGLWALFSINCCPVQIETFCCYYSSVLFFFLICDIELWWRMWVLDSTFWVQILIVTFANTWKSFLMSWRLKSYIYLYGSTTDKWRIQTKCFNYNL
jgi:hypothetical protein